MYPNVGSSGGRSESSTSSKPQLGCQATDERTGDVCGETGTLGILDEFQKVYQARIKRIDEDPESGDGDRATVKLAIMEEWVKDLGEQNAMLIQTVEELEREACNRVTLLEEKLQQSSSFVTESIGRTRHSEETLNVLTNRMSHLEKEEECLQQKIEFLQSDIRGLLELIRRARRENCWSLDGITFFEIQPSDIPMALDCTCGQDKEDAEPMLLMKQQLEQLRENEKTSNAYRVELEEKLAELNKQVNLKEETIRKYISKLQNLRDNLKKRSKLANQVILGSATPSVDLDSDIVTMADIVENALNTKELEVTSLHQQLQESETELTKLLHEKNLEINDMRNQLEQKCMELQQIEYRMACLQKESSETRDALTVEVAEKHDLVMSLRKEVATLEEQCRQSDMQTHFKDDIIKEMRRELKQAKSKETFSSSRKVRIKTEASMESGGTSSRDRLHEAQNHLKEMECTLALRIDESNKLRNELICQKQETSDLYKVVEKLQAAASQQKKEDEMLSGSTSKEQQTDVIAYLLNTKVLMEKEKEALLDLKAELEKILHEVGTKEREVSERDNSIAQVHEKLLDIEKLLNSYKVQVIDQSKSMEVVKSCMDATEAKITSLRKTLQNSSSGMYVEKESKLQMKNITRRLTRVLEIICKIHDDNENSTTALESMTRKYRGTHQAEVSNLSTMKNVKDSQVNDLGVNSGNVAQEVNEEVVQQLRIMEEFRVCTVEAQAATEDLREEMTNAIDTLNQRHQKYTELGSVVKQVQNNLTKTRENVCGVINQLKLQEQQKSRHSERIANGATKLKDMKNEINQIRCELSKCISSATDNTQECSSMGLVKMHTSDDLLNMVTEEVEQVVSNMQVYQSQASNAVSLLMELKGQLCSMECSLKDLQKKADEALLENEIAQEKFSEKAKKLDRLEQELDYAHSRMQEMLENPLAPEGQNMDEILKVKGDLRKVQKEYDDLRMKLLQDTSQSENEQKINEWRSRVADLQDQVRALQNESKCESAANKFLSETVEAMEKEISSAQTKAQTQRKNYSSDSAELKSKILELEYAARKHKEVEESLKRSLESSEIELTKSKEFLGSLSIPQSFKILQDAMQSTRSGLQDLGNELKKLVSEGSSHSNSSFGSFDAAIDLLRKYGESTEQCAAEIEKLKNTLSSKDKLLENKDEIIKIQKDSIKMIQAELIDLHQKLQEKELCKEKALRDLQHTQTENEAHAQTIAELQKERRHLLEESEHQIRTIGNLQDAVVEAKKRLDHMGNRAASELNDKDEAIRVLSLYLSESQNQYKECFTEAAKQDTTLELQRDAIDKLRQEMTYMDYDKYAVASYLHSTYYALLTRIQEQLQARVKDFEVLKIKMDALIKSKNCLEDKYMNVTKLWQESDQELQELKTVMLNKDNEIKCCQTEIARCKADIKKQESRTQELISQLSSNEFMTSAITQQLEQNLHEYERKVKSLTSIEDQLRKEIKMLSDENKDVKNQLQKYKLDFEIFEKELKIERKNSIHSQELQTEVDDLKKLERRLKSDNEQLKNDFGEHTRQMEILVNDLRLSKEREANLEEQLVQMEAKQKEKTEDLEKLNESLKGDMEILQSDNKNGEIKLMNCAETIGRLHDDIDMKNEEIKQLCTQIACFEEAKEEQACEIQQLEKKLQLNEQQTEECLSELNASKEMLCVLRDRICSLKCLLREKSDDMAKLQADYQMIKNANSISKNEYDLFENKAREDICDLKMRLKEVEFQLCLMEDNYHRVTQDFSKSQELLVGAAKREVDLQEMITTTEKNLLTKLAAAEREEVRLGDMVDKLSEELEDTRDELSSKNAKLCQAQCRCQAYAKQLETVQQDFEGMHKALLELRKECQSKTKSLACVSAELSQVAVSRSELCNESQYVVSCIRGWMEEQRKLVETLASKLNVKQQQLMQLAFEKKALLAIFKEVRRANSTLMQKLKRSHKSAAGRSSKALYMGCRTSPLCIPYCSNVRLGPSSSYSHLAKKCSVGPIRTARRTSVCGNSWWFPKMEHLTDELRKNNQWWNRNVIDRAESDPGLDESRDCGYQSSTSK